MFNPFTDRLSRDIRNDLSTTLLSCLSEGTIAPARAKAAHYLGQELDPVYVHYIHDRLQRYEQAVSHITGKVTDPFQQGFVLWDLELFFEMHEVLEHEWYNATGEKKLLLQALIRAAGVYIKLQSGLVPQAAKIGAKALPVLKEQQEFLSFYIPAEKLIDALHRLDPTPPKLLADR